MIRFDFPTWIDPVLVSLGPIQLTWYALAYMVGLIAGWQIMRWRVVADKFNLKPVDIDDYVIYALLGVILGGRIGNYAFGWGGEGFFDSIKAMFNPVHINPDGSWTLAISGMSFHGGFLGVVVATLIFWVRRSRSFSFWGFTDYLALVAPIGLFLGRLANFVNKELYGRLIGENAWIGISYEPGNPEFDPAQCVGTGLSVQECMEKYDFLAYRHPSQLYEAAGEGILLFIIIALLYRLPFAKARPGLLTGVFIAGYGIVRTLVEYVRTFEASVGLDALGLTRSQELSIPMVIFGLALIVWTHVRSTRA